MFNIYGCKLAAVFLKSAGDINSIIKKLTLEISTQLSDSLLIISSYFIDNDHAQASI